MIYRVYGKIRLSEAWEGKGKCGCSFFPVLFYLLPGWPSIVDTYAPVIPILVTQTRVKHVITKKKKKTIQIHQIQGAVFWMQHFF